MKYRVFLLLFCVVTALSLTGCSNDDQPTGPGVNNVVDSYYPVTKGTYWKYRTNTGGSSTSVVSGDTIVDGQKYAVIVVEGSSSGERSLVREQDNNIYIRNHEFGGYEVLYVKTAASIGEQWNFTLMVNGLENYYEYTMVAKGITKTVNGREYKDVLQTHTVLYAVLNGEKFPVSTAETFFAKGVGAISIKLANGQEMNLVEYQIK